MSHKLTEEEIERQQIECVFCLDGGELHEANAEFPDEWDGVIAYWYEGPPDYATEFKDCDRVDCPVCNGEGRDDNDEDCVNCDGYGHLDYTVRTAIIQALWGFPEPPKGYEQIGSFTTSGEADCWRCGAGTGNEETHREGCPLCEGDGLIYIGDGYAEVIYRTIEPAD